jgi:GNAT superfamily N-acetyltransferase
MTHVLGAPVAAAAAAVAVAAATEEIVAPQGTPVEPGRRTPHEWAVRLATAPCPPQPHEAAVQWLEPDAGGDVAGLLTAGNPHAAVRPGDPLGGRWFGTYDEGGLVACGVETVLARPRPHLSSLTVHPRARGRGLGAALTAWFVRRGLETGANEVMLAVDQDNAVADRLYDRLGFDRWPMTGFYVSREMT